MQPTSPPLESVTASRSDRPSVLAQLTSTTAWHWPVLLGVVAVALVYRLQLGPWPTDDAYITFRYVRHLVAGDGLVFNAGDRILGTSTPLFALLLALAALWGADIPVAAFALGVAADALVIVGVYLLLRRLDLAILGLLAGLLVAISSEYTYYTVSGLETPLYVCASVWCLWAAIAKRWRLMAVLAAALVLLRPDGALFVGVVFAWILARREAIGWRPFVQFGLLLLPWVVFATLYFGSPIPHSVTAKAAAARFLSPTFGAQTFALYFLNLGTTTTGSDKSPAIALFALAGLATILLDRRYRRLVPYAVWAIAYCSLMIVTNGFSFYPWYFLPLYPVYYTSVLLGIVRLFELAKAPRLLAGLTAARSAPFRQLLVPAALAVLLFGVALTLPLRIQNHRRVLADAAANREGAYRLIARYIVEHSAPAETIGADEIGTLGYYADRRIIDDVGLVTRAAVGKRPLEVIKELQPDWWVSYEWILVEVEPDPWFQGHYRLVSPPGALPQTMRVYRKVTGGGGWALSVGLSGLPHDLSADPVLAGIARYAVDEGPADHPRGARWGARPPRPGRWRAALLARPVPWYTPPVARG